MKDRQKIVINTLKKYPDTPLLTLAKRLYKKYPEWFNNLETTRASLRYYSGKCGILNRKSTEKKHQDIARTGEPNFSPFSKIPEGLKELGDFKPFHPKGSKFLLISDIHIPYHETVPLQMALEYGYKKGVDSVIILGDGVDFYSVSSFKKNPVLRNFNAELQTTRAVLQIIRDGFKDANFYYKIGNHEERYKTYMEVKAPEFFDVENFQFSKLLGLDKLNIKVIDDKKLMKIGKLNLIHGHEFGRMFSSPVNPARGLYLRGKENAICGHLHQSSNHSENTMNDAYTSTWSIGCLCQLHPQYAPINKWNHGFAIVERDGKNFEVFNKKIIDNRIYSV